MNSLAPLGPVQGTEEQGTEENAERPLPLLRLLHWQTAPVSETRRAERFLLQRVILITRGSPVMSLPLLCHSPVMIQHEEDRLLPA